MKSYSIALLFAATLALTGCGKGDTGPAGPAGPAGASAVTDSTLTDIQTLVDDENAYRASVGQEPLTAGLDCTLYTVPTSTTQIVDATLTTVGSFGYEGVFNQPNASVSTGLNILPPTLASVYQTWFIVKCTGDFVVSDSNWHSFSLSSDDGSNLYIDGLLINNDGLHSVQTVSNTKYLKYGLHSFELDFFQGAGMQALILDMDGALLDDTHYYH